MDKSIGRIYKSALLVVVACLLVFYALIKLDIIGRDSGEQKVSVSTNNEVFQSKSFGSDVDGFVLTDNQTGCQYIAINNKTSYTPRLDETSYPICSKNNKIDIDGQFKIESFGDDQKGIILYDNATECQYIATSKDSGLTPRLNSQGVPICRRTKDGMY